MIELQKISQDQLNRLLQEEESHFLDLKSIGITPSKLSKSVSAFANASGGDLYIGIGEQEIAGKKIRHWQGFADQEAANGHIQIFEQLFPLGQYYSYSFLFCESGVGLVLHVLVHKSREIAKASDEVPYIRRGAQSLPVKTEEGLNRLKLDKGITSFEKEAIDAELAVVTESNAISEFLTNVIPTAESSSWLAKQQLIQRGKPTVAGVLLFADEPQAILPKRCGIKIYRYRTKDNEGVRENLAFTPLTIEGCVYQQIKQAVLKVIDIVEKIPKVGEKSLERVTYPQEAIHEILTNAVLHRDYSIQTDIQIRVYDNRIEVESPGKLAGHVTTKNILNEQCARNGAVVRLINKFPEPPNQDVGEGLNTAFLAMSKLRLKPPEIQETDNSVVVYIRHESLASVEASIMEYLEKNNEITNKIGREISSASSDAVKDALSKLRKLRILRFVPGKHWKKIQHGDEIPEATLAERYPTIEKQILDHLDIHEEITSKTARAITGVESSTRMKDIFYKMKRKGLIEFVSSDVKQRKAWKRTC
jgi:ATP-dependent DNA helicase RecG